jgi:hypothetical protein
MAASYDALAACLMGDPGGAVRQISRAVHAAEAAGEPYLVAFVHSFHARLAVLGRDREVAWAAATRATDVAEKQAFPLLVAHAAIPLGWAQAGQGEPEAGLATIERGLAALHDSGQRILTPFHQGLRAEVVFALGDPQTALALLDEAWPSPPLAAAALKHPAYTSRAAGRWRRSAATRRRGRRRKPRPPSRTSRAPGCRT